MPPANTPDYKGPVHVIGAGGHGKSVAGVLMASGVKVGKIVDDHPETWGTTVLGIEVTGPVAEKLSGSDLYAIIGLGDNQARKEYAERLSHLHWFTLIYPSAYVNPTARIERGSVVFPGTVIGGDAVIGRHAIIATNSLIGHDTEVGDYVHLAPGCNVAGSVTVGTGAMVGIGSTVVPNIQIGDWATIGAGGVVVRNVEPHSTVFGVPAVPRQPKQD